MVRLCGEPGEGQEEEFCVALPGEPRQLSMPGGSSWRLSLKWRPPQSHSLSCTCSGLVCQRLLLKIKLVVMLMIWNISQKILDFWLL